MAAPTEQDASKIQIVGHSFVSRFKSFVRDDLDGAFHLNLQGPPLIQYSGFPGATVSTIRDNLDVVSDFDPDVVVLIIGTNDIYSASNSPASVAQQISDLVDTLLFILNIPQVVVLQVLHRNTTSRYTRYPVDPEWYNPRVDELNLLLNDKLNKSHHKRCHLWRLKGFWSPESKLSHFAEDGCHLSIVGQRKLMHNLKAAVVAALRRSICPGC